MIPHSTLKPNTHILTNIARKTIRKKANQLCYHYVERTRRNHSETLIIIDVLKNDHSSMDERVAKVSASNDCIS